ncbi:hypothetical protein RJ639_045114 [Escallonia herrerae]|uniref:adenylate dimethylallyltransferase (ADP/ATP-dependent) n=1 Tax=Escallonia herrerae TaxID=1293975 RepID=A0AA88W6K4_9ASTE|nr:hypothetical protein RJ639_045114 [Escallonia herrerae]
MNSFSNQFQKKKVVFIMGATGAGKSRLSVDLATHLSAEIMNSDKMQVYKGLDIVTNKIPVAEQQGVLHHLLGVVEPDADFTTHDFCSGALSVIKKIVRAGQIPIIVGGSNSYLEALVEDPLFNFRSKYECCFIWLDVSVPILYSSVSKRVDQMVDAGLVDEVRGMFHPEADYTRGIRKSIGVPEMDNFFRSETTVEETSKQRLLEAAIEEIKANTCKLVSCQLGKINRLRNELGWPMHRIDATRVLEKCGRDADDAWEEMVLKPCFEILKAFLHDDGNIASAAPKPNKFKQLVFAN